MAQVNRPLPPPNHHQGTTLRNFECVDFKATYLAYCRQSKLNVGGLYRGHCCSNENGIATEARILVVEGASDF